VLNDFSSTEIRIHLHEAPGVPYPEHEGAGDLRSRIDNDRDGVTMGLLFDIDARLRQLVSVLQTGL
jgi:hypothetical protein